jgi:thiol-disulfide isomerase/thioredoxin
MYMALLLDFWKKFTTLQKILLFALVATIVCSVWTDCAVCRRFPLKLSLHNPLEGYQDAAQTPTSLTIYTVPWCGYCKSFLASGEVEKLQQALAGTPILVTMVDAEQDKAAAKAAGVESFPTIQLVKQGKPVNYEGERTADSIMKWIALQ